jgi:hypothetical protein
MSQRTISVRQRFEDDDVIIISVNEVIDDDVIISAFEVGG